MQPAREKASAAHRAAEINLFRSIRKVPFHLQIGAAVGRGLFVVWPGAGEICGDFPKFAGPPGGVEKI